MSFGLPLGYCFAQLKRVRRLQSRHGRHDGLPYVFVVNPVRASDQGVKYRVGDVDREHRYTVGYCGLEMRTAFISCSGNDQAERIRCMQITHVPLSSKICFTCFRCFFVSTGSKS